MLIIYCNLKSICYIMKTNYMNSQTKNSAKMVVFDIDGVLLGVKRGSFKEIIQYLGKEKEIKDLHTEYIRRKKHGPWGLKQLAKLLAGTNKDYLYKIARGYVDARLQPGVDKLLKHFRKKKYIMEAISSNPDFVVQTIKELLSLDFAEGTQMEYLDGVATGNLTKEINRYGKADILQEKMKQYKCSSKDVIVIGDSLTDIPMSKHADTFIAFNPQKNELADEAKVQIKSQDISDILSIL